MSNYNQYLADKSKTFKPVGMEVDNISINPMLWEYQSDITKRALYAGRYLAMLDCGLGKTPIQLEWAHHVFEYTGKPVIILAPLQVTRQTIRESEKFNRPVRFYSPDNECNEIVNYEQLGKLDPSKYGGIVLDESSILKGVGSKTRIALGEFAESIPFRLCCSATPSPNDYIEIIRHAEFLGIATEKELKGEFFVQDGNSTNKWRLRGYAEDSFWEWLSSWVVAMRFPSDLGYSDDTFVRQGMGKHEIVTGGEILDGMLIPVIARTLQERRKARQSTIDNRCRIAARLCNDKDYLSSFVPDLSDDEKIVVWCNLNKEGELLASLIDDSVEIAGRHSAQEKADTMIDFSDNKVSRLITKPKIAGHGMNWQNSRIAIFVGLSDSYEQVYQAIRRQWRNGQLRDCHVFFVIAETEGAVMDNIKRKEENHNHMYDMIVKRISSHWSRIEKREMDYIPNNEMIIPSWLKSID